MIGLKSNTVISFIVNIIIISQLFIINCVESKIGFWLHDVLRSDSSIENHIYDLAKSQDYPIEEHDVTTTDGYILKLHRIPYSKNNLSPYSKNDRPIVFLQHGILACSAIWLIGNESRGLAYVLADAGYDVWMGNARGNTHSRRHTSLSINSHEFWDFTWHEIGLHDLPSMIDFVLEQTNRTQLHYVGHSQGTTTFFVMTSMRPEYNRKIKTMHALSPVAFMGNQRSIFFTIPSYVAGFLADIAKSLKIMELYPNSWLQEYIVQYFCSSSKPILNACYIVLSMMGGFNEEEPITDLIPDIMTATPAGASTFQALHFAQIVRNGKFQAYDRGAIENEEKYGQSTPPVYPLGNITTDLYLYVSSNDYISTLEDVDTFISKLPKQPNYIKIDNENWSHFDYVWGKQAKTLIYDKIVSVIEKTDNLNNFLIKTNYNYYKNNSSENNNISNNYCKLMTNVVYHIC